MISRWSSDLVMAVKCWRKPSFVLDRCPSGFGDDGRDRDEDFSSPPAQIPACAANAPGSSLGSDVVR
jgi:hypothetical protein